MLGSKLNNGCLTISFLSSTFEGSLDTTLCREIEPSLLKKLENEEYSDLVFDLSGINYIASSFIRICLSSAKKVGFDHFSIKNTNPNVKKIFKIAGLDKQLKVT